MTQEEAVLQAKENILVADHFQRKAENIMYDGTIKGGLTKEEVDEVHHLLGCADAHRWSAVEYLEGRFTHQPVNDA